MNSIGSGYSEYAFVADLYDHVGPYRSRPDVAFFMSEAVNAGSPVLELGCGTGRVLIPTARAGVEIVGLDRSPGMLEECRRRLRQEPEEVRARVELIQGDMCRFSLGRAFSLVTIPFRPFQHLVTVEDQLSCLDCIARHLAPEGMLILDLFNPSLDALVNRPIGEELEEGPEFALADGRRVTRRHRVVSYARAAQVNHIE